MPPALCPLAEQDRLRHDGRGIHGLPKLKECHTTIGTDRFRLWLEDDVRSQCGDLNTKPTINADYDVVAEAEAITRSASLVSA